MNLKSNKGITGVDISVALIILVLFTGLITSLMYNFSQNSKAINRKSDATYIAIQIIESIKQMDYDSIDENKIKTVQDVSNDIEVETGYTAIINIQNYRDIMNDYTLEDVLKVVKVTVEYTVGKQTQNVDISTVITKEE